MEKVRRASNIGSKSVVEATVGLGFRSMSDALIPPGLITSVIGVSNPREIVGLHRAS